MHVKLTSFCGNPLLPLVLASLVISWAMPVRGESVARQWNEELLEAIRIDFPAPTVHARNLFHLSVAMYDAWAAYDPDAIGFLHEESATAVDVGAARDEAVSYAAYRVLWARAGLAVNPQQTRQALESRMAQLGYDTGVTDVEGDSPAAVGNRCGAAVLAFGLEDGANEENGYADNTGYAPANPPLILQKDGVGSLPEANLWQPLAFDVRFTQNGLVAEQVQEFVSPHWGFVTPFVLSGEWQGGVYADYDPGAPPLLGGLGDTEFKMGVLEVIRHSAALDPENGEMLDISPGAHGGNSLGKNDGAGYGVNPVTGEPYAPNLVRHGDYGRVIAEFWADGPHSETPPGHWNVLANQVSEDPRVQKRLAGSGSELEELEWDVKLYLALNGAVHDAAVAAWGVKAHYDYVRPITSIRYLGGLGQGTDPDGASYHPDGLPLESGLVEVVTLESSAAGERHEHLSESVGKVAIRVWPGEPADPEVEFGGADWILAESWLPYQRRTFVTPAFAGYISGHSTFSRAAAEVLAAFTGSAFFPGGLGTHEVPAGALEFELGPSEDIQLQWATYYDAADEAGLSRIYGGIHVPADDGPGRVVGSKIGKRAFERALGFFDGSVLSDFSCRITSLGGGEYLISWPCVAGHEYKVQVSTDCRTFADLTEFQAYPKLFGSVTVSLPSAEHHFYRVIRKER